MIEVPTIEVAQVPDPIPDGVTVLDVREPIEWHHGHIDVLVSTRHDLSLARALRSPLFGATQTCRRRSVSALTASALRA